MKNKGFTLIELLVSILIISLLSGITVYFSTTFYKTNEERYYNAIESNVLLAGNDYFEDHRDELPTGSNYSEVSLANLIDSKYIEKVTDTNGNTCREGSVFAYRENNKYKYEVCLIECGGYSSTGRYCSNKLSREITVVARTKTTNVSYDVTKSYNSINYTKNENVVVTLGMNEEFNITKYIVRNTKDNSEIECNTSGNNTCVVEIDKSGTYKVESYHGNEEISSRYINVKIAKNGSNFTLNTSDGQRKYLISQSDCSSNKKTKNVVINIIKGVSGEEYKTVEYKVNNGEYTSSSSPINLTLPSGHYDIEVVVTNYNDNVSVETISIDVSYLINIEYNDDNSTATHEVVKGQTYNYLSSLPSTKNGNNIKWYNGETLINPSTDIVEEDCTYKLDGVTKISYTLNYSDNLFAACTQSTHGVVATYTEDGSYLTLDGTGTSKSIVTSLWNHENRSIGIGDEYKITIKHISGTLTCSDSATCTGPDGKPMFVFELTKNGSNLSDRTTSPYSYKTVALPVSGTNEATFIVDSSRADTDGLKYWLWQNNENVATFSDYKVQIIITKVHSKSVVYNEQYGTLDTPEKTGYTFNGWYTSITGGSKVTSTTIYSTEGDQTVYARYTSHKLNLQYNGNGSDVTWCSTSSIYGMNSSKYAIIQSSSSINTHVVAYGQYMSYTSGLNNYNNKDSFCFSNAGYKAVSGEEWVLSTNSSKKYDQYDKTYTAIGIASDAGCDLKTTSTCTAQVNVNWAPNGLTFNDQSISRAFSNSAQTFDLTEASNGTGTYTYTITSQPSGNYFSISGATATIKANTPSGSYTVVIRATDSKSNATKEATYTVTIGATAPTCPTLTAYSGTYDGSAHTIEVSGGSGGTIKYRKSTSGEWTTTKPTRTTAGTTTVYVMIAGDANHSDKDCGNKKITIDKKAVTITAKAQTINYGGSIATGTGQITVSGLVANHSVTDVTLTASTTDVTTTGKITPSAATIENSEGTDRTSSYDITYATGKLTINKVDATCPTLTAYSGTYDESSHTISVSGGSGGTIKYRKTTTEEWTTTKPKRTIAGTTTVYVMMTGDANHNDKDCGNKTITVDKKAVTITAKAQTINYGGSIATGTGQITASGLITDHSVTAITLTASTTSATTSGKITPSAATIKNASGTDRTSSYDITYATGALTINKVDATCPTLTAYSGTFDNTYHTIEVSGGNGGTIKYRTSTTEEWTTTKPKRLTAGTTTVYVMMTGDSNHNDKDCGNKKITVDKKAVTITAKAQTINYGESIATGTGQITASGLITDHSVTAITLTASTTSITTTGKITPSEATIKNASGTDRTSSYDITYATGALTINKADATCPTLTAYSGTFDNTSHTISVSGGSGGTIKYRKSTTEEWTTTKPTRLTAGTTTVYVMVEGDANHNDKDCGSKKITIDKKAVTITAKAQTINYGGSIATGTDQITVSGLITNHSVTAITLTASTTSATTSGKITPSAATIKNASGTDRTSSYDITYATGALTINKVDATCPTLTAYSGTYDGSSHTISVSGGSGGTIKYRKSTTGEWTTTKPKRVSAGTTTVYVMVDGDANHNDKDCGNKKITLAKATPTLTMTASSASFMVGGTRTYGITPDVDGHFDYNSTNTSVVRVNMESDVESCKKANNQCVFKLTGVSPGSIVKIDHVYTPDDLTNYTTASVTFTATVTPAVQYRWRASCSCPSLNTYYVYGGPFTTESAAATDCRNNSLTACVSSCQGQGMSLSDSCTTYTA